MSLIGRGNIMNSYIAFMDILGTKAVAIANPILYRTQIRCFHDCISKVLKKYTNVKCYVYSDCAYFMSDSLAHICKCFILLREDLLSHRICFNAAICEGDLGVSNKNIEQSIILDFEKESVVKVYSMQSCFSGAGIYLDSDLVKKKAKLLKDIPISKSLYKNINKYSGSDDYFECFDLGFGRISDHFIKNILIMYLKCYLSDKRAARYYYTPYTTYLRGLDIDSYMKTNNTVVTILEIVKNVPDENIQNIFVLILINCIYDAEKNTLLDSTDLFEINIKLKEILDFIYEHSELKKVNNIKEYSEAIISNENKMLIVDYCMDRKILI